MTSRIFIYNFTNVPFLLYDLDNHLFGTIPGGGASTFRLNYSSTFVKQYNLVVMGTTNTISFTLTINGEIGSVGTGIALLQVGSETRWNWNVINRLTIYSNGILPPAPPQLAPYTPRAVLFYNDY